MQNTNVLISGAGIAGTALAYWLRRHGFRPTVVERAPELRDGGYKIDVRGAAIEVADRMGMLDDLRQRRTEVRSASFVNDVGDQLATMDGDLFGGRKGDDVELLRGDLNRILYAKTKDHVSYVFGDAITGVTQGPDGVRVDYERGESRTFDLVIGADGLHSVTRELVFGDEGRFVRDLGHHVSVFSVPNHLGLDREEVTYPTPGRTAIVYSTRHDAGAKAMFLFASAPGNYDLRDVDQQKKFMADTFADARWEVPRLIAEMRNAPDFYFDALSQVHMDRWSDGRVALLGDAAYGPSPASGQGTSLALVGAYVLAGELARSAGDQQSAFSHYERRLSRFVELNQSLAHNNLKGMVMKSRVLLRSQMVMLRLLPHLPGKNRIIGRVADAIHDAATAIKLEAY